MPAVCDRCNQGTERAEAMKHARARTQLKSGHFEVRNPEVVGRAIMKGMG